jgi:hypothetical protein
MKLKFHKKAVEREVKATRDVALKLLRILN